MPTFDYLGDKSRADEKEQEAIEIDVLRSETDKARRRTSNTQQPRRRPEKTRGGEPRHEDERDSRDPKPTQNDMTRGETKTTIKPRRHKISLIL